MTRWCWATTFTSTWSSATPIPTASTPWAPWTITTRPNFYDGKIRVVDPEGKELVKFAPRDYLQVLAEHVEPWTYLKFPFLKQVGWKGFVDGKDSGVYRATPLSRLNAADGMATPLAQEQYDRVYKTLGANRYTRRWPPTGLASSSCSTPPSGPPNWRRTTKSSATKCAPSPPPLPRKASAAWKRRAERFTIIT